MRSDPRPVSCRGHAVPPARNYAQAPLSREAFCAHCLAASTCSGVSQGQLATMRDQELPSSTHASNVEAGSRDPTNTGTPPMVSGSQWMTGGLFEFMAAARSVLEGTQQRLRG